jgi:putative protease
MGELEHLAHRGYTDGFLQRHPEQAYQNYESSQPDSSSQRFVAELLSYDAESGLGEFDVKNRFALGDRVELILPEGNRSFVLESMQDPDGAPLREAPGSGYRVRLPLPANRYSFALLARHL